MPEDKTFSASIVRGACERIYGSPIEAKAWARWKDWVGAPKGRITTYTSTEFCMLVGIAKLRSKNQFRELRITAIKKIAFAATTIEMIGALAEHVENEGWAIGWDIQSALVLRGYEIDNAFLKKIMPDLSPNKWYQVDYVIRKLERAVYS